MFLIPASVAPLRSIHLGNDSLLLTYADHRARLWSIKTGEFWRSMDLQKAAQLRTQGDWKEWYDTAPINVLCFVPDRDRPSIYRNMHAPHPESLLSAFPLVDGFDHGKYISIHPLNDYHNLFAGSALLLDVEEFIRQCVHPKTASTVDIPSLALPSGRSSARQALQSVLSMLFTFGLNDGIDRICIDALKADRTRPLGTLSQYAFTLCHRLTCLTLIRQ